MKCEDVKKRIMEDDIDNRVWRHVKECKECMSFMEIYTELNNIKEIKVPEDYNMSFKKLRIKKILKIISVAAIFIIFIGTSSLWIHEKIQINKMKNRIDKIAMDINEDNSYFLYSDY